MAVTPVRDVRENIYDRIDRLFDDNSSAEEHALEVIALHIRLERRGVLRESAFKFGRMSFTQLLARTSELDRVPDLWKFSVLSTVELNGRPLDVGGRIRRDSHTLRSTS